MNAATADTTMTSRPRDPLLLAGKALAIFMQAAMAIGAFALVVAIPALLLFRDQAAAEFAQEAGDPSVTLPVLLIIIVMVIGLAIVGMLFVFFGKLRQIIATVGEGDPFQPANAGRLSAMGWLMLGVQILLFPAMAVGMRLSAYADEIENGSFTIQSDLDFTGILLVIILFILARVFRHGAAMREDLEGTV